MEFCSIEEINANAFVRPDNTTKELFLSENINNYLRKYTTNKKAFSSEFYNEKKLLNSIHKVSL